MLRRLAVVAPAVAAMMVVVLLVEPPALRPAERIPTLRVFTTSVVAALAPSDVKQAIALGVAGEPPLYSLVPVDESGTRTSDLAAGAVYTPFLRVAWASYRRARSGQPLRLEEVPAWMTAPVAYVALRTPEAKSEENGTSASLAVVPPNFVTCCQEPQPSLAIPVWVVDDTAPLWRFGAPPPFNSSTMVAAYPLATLDTGVHFVAYKRLETPAGLTSIEVRGWVDPDDIDAWR